MVTNTTHGNAKKTDNSNSKSNQLIEHQPIKGTPFTAIKYENEWYLTMGKYRLTTGRKTLREVLKESKDASWERIMQIIQILIDEDKKQTK